MRSGPPRHAGIMHHFAVDRAAACRYGAIAWGATKVSAKRLPARPRGPTIERDGSKEMAGEQFRQRWLGDDRDHEIGPVRPSPLCVSS
jgi:hypothetical protein